MTHKEIALIGGGAALAIVAITIAILVPKRNAVPSTTPDVAKTSAVAPPPTAQAPIQSAPILAVEPKSPIEFREGWAVIPRPGKDIPDSPENRITYMGAVMKEVQGEPKINKAKATQLMQRLRASFAKNAGISQQVVKVNVGDSAASFIVNDGVKAELSAKGKPYEIGACSEVLLGAAMVEAKLAPAEFAAVGVRGLLCKSDGCVAIFDMRPTSSGGGLYGGAECLSLADAMKVIAP